MTEDLPRAVLPYPADPQRLETPDEYGNARHAT